MNNQRPLVSIGLPVYNGEDYLEQAIDSILRQTYPDWELLISDNHSNDTTEEICRQAQARDPRVRYIRQSENLGAAANYDLVVDQTNGPYFKWMAHDDVCQPRFIEVCVDVLEREPSVVLAYPSILDINEKGDLMGPCDADLGFDHADPSVRFRRTMSTPHRCVPIFGVMRREMLVQTAGHGNFPSSDRNLLGEIALYGRLIEVPEPLLLHREHDDRFSVRFRTTETQQAWLDPKRSDVRNLPTWRRLISYLRAIRRSRVSTSTKLRCFQWMTRWAVAKRRDLINEVLRSLRRHNSPLSSAN